jgi:cytochrome c
MRLRRRALAPALAALAAAMAAAACDGGEPPAGPVGVAGGDARAGHRAVALRDCGVCHAIPGVRGARGKVGPSLAGFGGRGYVAGVLPNTPDNLVRWLQEPQAVAPRTAMPDFGIGPGEARDIAAFLYALR